MGGQKVGRLRLGCKTRADVGSIRDRSGGQVSGVSGVSPFHKLVCSWHSVIEGMWAIRSSTRTLYAIHAADEVDTSQILYSPQ